MNYYRFKVSFSLAARTHGLIILLFSPGVTPDEKTVSSSLKTLK
jgi:hypothetical protein